MDRGAELPTEYICLNMPEPLRLGSREDVEQHFREAHVPNIISRSRPPPGWTGQPQHALRGLYRAVRQAWEDQSRFPIQVATVLSQQFAARGLQFFKVNRTVTHVAVARPHYLDLDAAPVSEGVRRIVEFINGNAKCTRRNCSTRSPLRRRALKCSPRLLRFTRDVRCRDSRNGHGCFPAGRGTSDGRGAVGD